MESTKKKNIMLPVILGIVCVVLIIIVLLGYRQNTELKRELKKATLTEKTHPDLIEKVKTAGNKPANPPPKMTRLPDNMSDKEKIIKLESQIADMQAWQDYLEESLQKYQNEEEKRDALRYNSIRNSAARTVDAFAEDYNISSSVKTELIDLLTERNIEMQEIWSGDLSNEEKQQQADSMTKKYNDIISEKYPEYNEYLKVQQERYYVTRLKSTMSPENQLDKDQEKSLMTAFYNDKQIFEEANKEIIDSLKDNDRLNLNEETLEKVFELQKELNSRFVDSASTILSEPQLQEFQKYIDSELSRMEKELRRMKDMAKGKPSAVVIE